MCLSKPEHGLRWPTCLEPCGGWSQNFGSLEPNLNGLRAVPVCTVFCNLNAHQKPKRLPENVLQCQEKQRFVLQLRENAAFFPLVLLLCARWVKALRGERSVYPEAGLFCHVGGWSLGAALRKLAEGTPRSPPLWWQVYGFYWWC